MGWGANLQQSACELTLWLDFAYTCPFPHRHELHAGLNLSACSH
jgi:hypothetical protein